MVGLKLRKTKMGITSLGCPPMLRISSAQSLSTKTWKQFPLIASKANIYFCTSQLIGKNVIRFPYIVHKIIVHKKYLYIYARANCASSS